MKYMVNRQKGFTLIEAVVVAVIMGILAAVAIPMYVGYIRDQHQTTVNNLAETAAAAANAFLRRTGNNPTSPSNLNLYFNQSQFNVDLSGNQVTVTENGTSYTSTKNF